MLGVVTVDADDPADLLLREYGAEIGADRTYAKTRVGVYFGTPGETVADPFFGGDGPARTGCIQCGRCMVGCPYNAKNTLPKNYLWLAERAGATIEPERTVVDIRPLGAPDGSDGYAVTSERTGAWLRPRPPRRTRRAASSSPPARSARTGCSQRAKLSGSLPRVSDRLGELVRTNSEAILAVTLPPGSPDMTKRVAISSSVYPDPDTHIETVTYGAAGDSISALYTLLVGDGTRADAAAEAARRDAAPPDPAREGHVAARLVAPHDHRARHAVARQRDRAARRRGPFGGVRLTTEQDPERPNPTFIPVANEFAEWLARAHRRDRPELPHGGGREHPDDRAHPRRRGDRRRPLDRRRRRTPARLRL